MNNHIYHSININAKQLFYIKDNIYIIIYCLSLYNSIINKQLLNLGITNTSKLLKNSYALYFTFHNY